MSTAMAKSVRALDDDSGTAHTADQPRTPNPDLKRLDTLVGTWAMSGAVHGTVTYAWMDGGCFLIQHVNLEQQDGQHTKGMEMIGHLHRDGESARTDIHSRSYARTDETLDDVSELEGETLTIWFGARGSPA
jgi:hypothetical protein